MDPTPSDPRRPSRGSESGKIARAVGVLSSATLLSRVLGLLRDVVLAAAFGAGGALDAFFVAFRLPNTLRRLFAEGSLTVAVVPVFVETLETGGDGQAHRLGRRAFTLLGVVLALVSAAGVWGAPALVRATAWGFLRDPDKFALTVHLTRLVFPFIALVGLTALAGGMLNAWGVFSYPALAPVVLNLCMIAAVVGLAGVVSPPVESLAYGVLAGGLLQLALQWPPLRRRGFRFRPDFRWGDPAIRKILRLMGPTVFGVAVYQVNILVSTFLASWLPDGSVSYLYYAERLFQLPLGVFAVSLGTASLPSLSRLAARGDREGFRRTLAEALRMTGFIVLPAAAGLLVLARPILVVLLQRGAFDAATVEATARALVWYAVALLPVAGVRVLAPAFYALQDTRTPVWAAFWSLWVNLAASLVLMGPMLHAGLALATALSSGFNFVYLALHLRRRVGLVVGSRAWRCLGRTAAATGVMAALVLAGARVPSWGAGSAASAAALGGLVAGGAAAYLGAARLLGLSDAARLLGLLSRRLGGG
ncbi:MAG: murein biosynthesis integral membrane protein MurJ [Deferrisomatales bacterium]